MPFNLPRLGASESGPRRTYRQPAMVLPGVILALVCLAFVIAVLFGSGVSEPDQFLWPFAGLLVVWVVFLRPCVQLTQAGVVMRNLVRDIHFGWPSIDLVEQRWNLKIFDEHGKGFGSWAIAAQRPKRAMRARSGSTASNLLRLGPEVNQIDEKDPTSSVMRVRGGSAAGVASQIRTGQQDYADALRRDPSVQADDRVRAEPAWPALGALALAVVLVVLGVVLG